MNSSSEATRREKVAPPPRRGGILEVAQETVYRVHLQVLVMPPSANVMLRNGYI
jgi:hypothetical protein